MSPKALKDSSNADGAAAGGRQRNMHPRPGSHRPGSQPGRRGSRAHPPRSRSAPIRPSHVALWLVCGTASAVVSAKLALQAREATVSAPTPVAALATPSDRPARARSGPALPRSAPPSPTAAGTSTSPPATGAPAGVPALAAVDAPLAAAASVGAAGASGSTGAAAARAAQVLSDVAFVAESHGPQVRACYDRAFRHDPAAPSGRVELSFTLVDAGDFGRAVDVRPELNLLGNPTVASCLAELVGEWRFPRPAGGQPQPVRYPFLFSAASP